jgi:hypothetical protein
VLNIIFKYIHLTILKMNTDFIFAFLLDANTIIQISRHPDPSLFPGASWIPLVEPGHWIRGRTKGDPNFPKVSVGCPELDLCVSGPGTTGTRRSVTLGYDDSHRIRMGAE